MEIQPYLFFEGRCEEAAEFYTRALGAEITMLMRYRESPEPSAPGMLSPGSEDKVMHMSLRIGETTVLASDGRCSGQCNPQGFALSLTLSKATEAQRYFNALGEGGKVVVPLAKSFFSESFGMVVDKFGVMWMVYATP
jgi:PhnB protein